MTDCQTYAPTPCPSAPLPALAPAPRYTEPWMADVSECADLVYVHWLARPLAEMMPHYRDFDGNEERATARGAAALLDALRWWRWLARPLWLDGAWRCPGAMVEACEVRT